MKKTFEINGKVCEVIVAFDTDTLDVIKGEAIEQLNQHHVAAYVNGEKVFDDWVRADNTEDLEKAIYAAELQAKQYANLRMVFADQTTARTMLTRLGYSE